MTDVLALLLAALALAVAWLIFRLEHAASRRRDIAVARASLLAFRHVAEGVGEKDKGWGEIYFGTSYTAATAFKRALQASEAVQKKGWDQIFVVPTEPLERLATTPAGGDLVSAETVFAANWGLWRLRVFNQLVTQQGVFNMSHAVDIFDDTTPKSRRTNIAQAAQEISEGIHLDGIGQANAPGNWYRRLTNSVAADLNKLDAIEKTPWWRYPDGRRLAFGDAAAVALCTAFIVLAIFHAIDGGDGGKKPGQTTTSTTASPSTEPDRSAEGRHQKRDGNLDEQLSAPSYARTCYRDPA